MRASLSVVLVVLLGCFLLMDWSNSTPSTSGNPPNQTPSSPEVSQEPIPTTPFREEATATVPLTGGTVQLSFRDARDWPVAGVKVRIVSLPSGTFDPAVSNNEGIVQMHVPSGEYVWVHEGNEPLQMNPAQDNVSAVTRNGDPAWAVVHSMSQFGHKVSKQFSVGADATTAFRVLVHRGAAVRGRVPPCDASEVRILHLAVFDHPSGRLEREELREVVRHDTGGEFFYDVPPGDTVIEASWRNQDNISFARLYRLVQDVVVDVGVLVPSAYPSRPVQISISRGSTNVPFAELFGSSPVPRQLPVSFEVQPIPQHIADEWHVLANIEVDKPLQLIGLPMSVAVQVEFDPPGHLALTGPNITNSPLAIDIVYSLPDSAGTSSAGLVLKSLSEPRVYWYILSEEKTVFKGDLTSNSSVSLALLPGKYRLIAHTQRASPSAVPQNLLCQQNLVVTPGHNDVTLALTAAQTFKGSVVDADGLPISSKVLSFRPPGVSEWIYSVCTDVNGNFILLGIPGELECLQVPSQRIVPGTGLLRFPR